MTGQSELTIEKYIEKTADHRTTLGSGCAAALTGALAAALTEMSSSSTAERKWDRDTDEELRQIQNESHQAREILLRNLKQDSESLGRYRSAAAMPKDTDEEKKTRHAAMQASKREAVLASLHAVEETLNILPLAELCIEKGSRWEVTDGLIAAMMARTGILSTLLTVRLNLQELEDLAFIKDTTEKVDLLTRQAILWENRILYSQNISRSIAEAEADLEY